MFENGRKRENTHPLMHFPNACNGQVQSWEPGTQSVNDKDPVIEPSSVLACSLHWQEAGDRIRLEPGRESKYAYIGCVQLNSYAKNLLLVVIQILVQHLYRWAGEIRFFTTKMCI